MHMHHAMQADPQLQARSPELIIMQGRRQAALQMQGGPSGALIVRLDTESCTRYSEYKSV